MKEINPYCGKPGWWSTSYMNEQELLPDEKTLVKGLVEKLPSQAFSAPKVETAVDRINKEIMGWKAVVAKATIRIEYLEKLKEGVEK